jgi:hypothetical protein
MGIGTPRELKPIAEQVLAWVAKQKELPKLFPSADELRRIELCAKAVLEMAMLHELYEQNPLQSDGSEKEVLVASTRKQDDNSETQEEADYWDDEHYAKYQQT